MIWVGGGGWGGHFYWYAARGFKKVPAIFGDFDFFPQKPPVLKIQLDFFPLTNVFEFFFTEIQRTILY